MLEFISTFGTSAPNYVYLFLIMLQYLRTDSYTVRLNHMERYRLNFGLSMVESASRQQMIKQM